MSVYVDEFTSVGNSISPLKEAAPSSDSCSTSARPYTKAAFIFTSWPHLKLIFLVIFIRGIKELSWRRGVGHKRSIIGRLARKTAVLTAVSRTTHESSSLHPAGKTMAFEATDILMCMHHHDVADASGDAATDAHIH